MSAADTIAKIRARRITASSITQSELVELAEAAEQNPASLPILRARVAELEEERRRLAARVAWLEGER